MRSGRVRIFNGNQWETLSLITQERIGVGASNLVGIIDVGVDACGIHSRSVGQTNRKQKYGGHSQYKIRVGDSKNVIVFHPLLTGHVIRRMRSGRVRISHANQWETLSLITQERIGVGASNLVRIIDVWVDACGILSRSVGQTNRK